MSGNIPSLQTLQYSTKHIIKDLYNQFRTGVDRDSPRLAAMGLITSCKSLSLYFFFQFKFPLVSSSKKTPADYAAACSSNPNAATLCKTYCNRVKYTEGSTKWHIYTHDLDVFFSSFFHSFLLFLYVVCQPSVINHLICPW